MKITRGGTVARQSDCPMEETNDITIHYFQIKHETVDVATKEVDHTGRPCN